MKKNINRNLALIITMILVFTSFSSLSTYSYGAPQTVTITASVNDVVSQAKVKDTTPPAQPTGLAAVPGDKNVVLTWAANMEVDLANYQLQFKNINTKSWSTESLLDKTYTTYSKSNLINGTTYLFRIRAQDNSRNWSAYSDTVSVTPVSPGVVAVTGVGLDMNAISLTAGGVTGTIIATVSPANATNKIVTWSSDNTNVATVAGGVVTPLASGTTIITVTTADGGFTATCTATVAEPVPVAIPVTGVGLDMNAISLTAGGVTGTIIANVSPSNATNKIVTWSSDNTNVVTVAGGVVTPLASGTAIITVTTADGGFTATCMVTVTDPVTNPTVIFSKARITPLSTYFSDLGYTNANIDNIQRVLWGQLPTATIAGVYVESGVFSTSGGALVINADKITQSLLDWLNNGIYTGGRIALEITSSNGLGFLEGNPDNSNIENTPGSTALSMVTVDYLDWYGTTIRVDLDNLESGTNFGTLLMIDGNTKADFQVITIGN